MRDMGNIMEIYFDVYGNDNLLQEIDNSVLLNIFKAFNGFPYFVLFPPENKIKEVHKTIKEEQCAYFPFYIQEDGFVLFFLVFCCDRKKNRMDDEKLRETFRQWIQDELYFGSKCIYANPDACTLNEMMARDYRGEILLKRGKYKIY